MKKILALVMVLGVLGSVMVGCSGGGDAAASSSATSSNS